MKSSYKTVPRSCVANYAKASGISVCFNEFAAKLFDTLVCSISEDVADSIDALEDHNQINLFPILEAVSLDETELKGHIEPFSKWWTIAKPIERIEHSPDLIAFQLMENYESAVEVSRVNRKNSFLNIFPTICEIETPQGEATDWYLDSVTLGDDETIEQHRDVIESLVRMEQEAMAVDHGRMELDSGIESFELDAPLLPSNSQTSISMINNLSDMLNSEPTLADLDLSPEQLSLPEELQQNQFNSIDLDAILNDAKLIEPGNNTLQFQLELPEYCEPQSIAKEMLDGPALLANLIATTQNSSWTRSSTPEGKTTFVDEAHWQESISETSMMRLPLPIVEKTCLETKITPQLPKFEFPEWKISYAVVCSLNWTPFSTIKDDPGEKFTEFKQYPNHALEVDLKYTTKEVQKIFKPIEKCINVADFSTIEDGEISRSSQVQAVSVAEAPAPKEVLQTSILNKPHQTQLDEDLAAISSDESDVEILDSKAKILETSDIIQPDISAFHGFSSVYEPPDTGTQSTSTASAPAKRKIDISFDDFDDSIWSDPESVKECSVLASPHKAKSYEPATEQFGDLENDENTDFWTSLNQVVAKRKKGISMPQAATLPQLPNLFAFSPYFNQPAPNPDLPEPLLAPRKESLSTSSSARDSSMLDYLNTSQSAPEKNLLVVWAPPLISPTSNCRVIVNTSNNTLATIRSFNEINCALEVIEADLGGADDMDGASVAAHFYLSYKACVMLLPLIATGQKSISGELKAITKLKNLKASIELIFVIIIVDQPTDTSSSSSKVQINKADEENLNKFQVTVAKFSWVQSFVLGCNTEAPHNLANFVAHLANIHGTDLPFDLFHNVPQRSIQFLKLCGINCVAAALLLRDMSLLDLIQMPPAYLGIKYGDLLSQDQQVTNNFLRRLEGPLDGSLF